MLATKKKCTEPEQAFAEIFAKAIELGGTITGEHGVGAMKASVFRNEVR